MYCPREFQRVLVSCLAWRSSQMWNPWVAASTKRVMLNTWERTNLGDHTQPQCNQGTDHYKQKKNYVERAFHLLLFILVHDNFCLIIVESNVFHRWLFRQLIVSSLLGLFKLNYCYGSQGSRREWASSKHVFWFYKISKTAWLYQSRKKITMELKTYTYTNALLLKGFSGKVFRDFEAFIGVIALLWPFFISVLSFLFTFSIEVVVVGWWSTNIAHKIRKQKMKIEHVVRTSSKFTMKWSLPINFGGAQIIVHLNPLYQTW